MRLKILSFVVATLTCQLTFAQSKQMYFVSNPNFPMGASQCKPIKGPIADMGILEDNRAQPWYACQMSNTQAQILGKEGAAFARVPVEPQMLLMDGSIEESAYVRVAKKKPEEIIHLASIQLKKFFPTGDVEVLEQDPIPIVELHLSDIKKQVLKDENFWERVDMEFVFTALQEEGFMITPSIHGTFASGLGEKPPPSTDYSSLEPTYSQQLTKFKTDVVAKLAVALSFSSGVPVL